MAVRLYRGERRSNVGKIEVKTTLTVVAFYPCMATHDDDVVEAALQFYSGIFGQKSNSPDN
jgi:hypothetical protein